MNYIYIDLPFINVDLESAATLAFDLSGLVTGTYLTITISRGDVLRFRLRYKDGDHPFWIKTSKGIGRENGVTTGISGVGNGHSWGLLIWNTTEIEEGTYYYECQRTRDMGGEIHVVREFDFITIIIIIITVQAALIGDLPFMINILECLGNELCTGLSDTCTNDICMCGESPKCSSQTSDTCEDGTCKCGANVECVGAMCISGVCKGSSFS